MTTLEPPTEGVPAPPHYQDTSVTLHHGDCLDELRSLPDCSVDSVVTDPPYGLEFMGKEWDSFGGDSRQPFRGEIQTPDNPYGRSTVRYAGAASYGGKHVVQMRAFGDWCESWADECLRVLKPGGHLLAFGGTRTWHRLASAVEDSGFEMRDNIAWLYGSGFPKSLNLVDNEGERTGWGTALKPAFEPIVVARKPLVGTVASNVLMHGTGALNVDGCRIESEATTRLTPPAARASTEDWRIKPGTGVPAEGGRWPANVILDESQADALDVQSGDASFNPAGTFGHEREDAPGNTIYGDLKNPGQRIFGYGDHGGASRFFYAAKADVSERVKVDGIAHPTVKPLSLMRWLVRLVTPPGGVVLEPFAGSGTTVEACILEGFRCVAIERDETYLPLIVQRINRRRDPVAAVKATGDDGGLFDLLGGGAA